MIKTYSKRLAFNNGVIRPLPFHLVVLSTISWSPHELQQKALIWFCPPVLVRGTLSWTVLPFPSFKSKIMTPNMALRYQLIATAQMPLWFKVVFRHFVVTFASCQRPLIIPVFSTLRKKMCTNLQRSFTEFHLPPFWVSSCYHRVCLLCFEP